MPKSILWALAASALAIIPVNALEMQVSYDVQKGSKTGYDVYVELHGYPENARKLVANCRDVFIDNYGVNPYITDLSCDDVRISTGVTSVAIVTRLGELPAAEYALDSGQHQLNGLPFLVTLPPAIAPAAAKVKTKTR